MAERPPFDRLAPVLRAVAAAVVPLLVGLAGAWIGMIVFGPREVPMGPFQVRLEGGFGRGATVIALPPFGRVTADTHVSPLRLTGTLQDVRVPELSTLITQRGTRGLVNEVERDAIDRLIPFAARLTVVAVLSALVGCLLVFRSRRRLVGVGTLGTAVIVVLSQVATWATFSPSAFTQPTYSGSLALAPQLIGPVREATDRIEDFRAELERIVTGAVRAYTSIQTGAVTGEDSIRVLHISDVHLSPLGQDFAAQVARGFDVDLVIDTGDLTSFGTPPEQFVLREISNLGLPYVFARGNHDSRALQRAMEGIENVVVVDGGDPVDVEGLTIYGLGHPVFTPDKEQAVDDRAFAEAARAEGERILADLEGASRAPDVVAVHDDRMAEDAAGLVPLVISGHFHENRAFEERGTLFLRIGSTGGSGFGVFAEEGGLPLSAQVLYFGEGPDGLRLLAWDVIQQFPETGSFTLDRHVVAQEFGELELRPPGVDEEEEDEEPGEDVPPGEELEAARGLPPRLQRFGGLR